MCLNPLTMYASTYSGTTLHSRREKGCCPNMEGSMKRIASASFCTALTGVFATVFISTAHADVVTFDELQVVKNGAVLFDDSFNRNVTLNGGQGSTISSGTTFSNG